jgi:PD-(D/E)XK nuclease superfamily
MAKHSYSGIKSFETCGRKYQEEKVLKLYPREDTEATLYGTQLHEQAELYIRDGRELDPAFQFLKPILDPLRAMPGRKFAEYEMALTEQLEPCDFKSEDYWVRGIADLIIVNDDNLTARVFDYKSGSDKYPDTDQLMLMSLMIFKHFPHIRSVSGGLLFVLKNSVHKYKVHRDQEADLWWRWRERVAKLDAALYHDKWHTKPSGLCRKYCPCVGCEHNGRRT